ncbi:hypothetical protein [Leptothrix ochracea]|uniref:hypothetical protein n=1 Tax=Leptothrix ochracea TaxID=735331 RepID=UPI0012E9D6A4|nr:hypothetical protein [Leptothrix ochracea]
MSSIAADGLSFDFKQLGVAVLVLAVMAGVVHAWNPDLMRRSATLYGPAATRVTVDIQALLQSNAGLSEADRVTNTNIFINGRLIQDLDKNVWGVEDYWASPMEFFQRSVVIVKILRLPNTML